MWGEPVKRVGILVILAISVYGLAWTAVYATADRSAVQFRMDGGQSSSYPNVPLQGLYLIGAQTRPHSSSSS